MQDDYRHKGLRKRLVEEIRGKGIKDERVLEAINKVPRHLFIQDNTFVELVYKDQALPIGAGQTISQPYTVAFQSSLLDVEKFHKVLEIGTGSGYQAAVLVELGAKVYTIERQRELFVKTKVLLPRLGYHPHFFYGDGYKGLPTYGPFDRILVTAGAPEIPGELLKQLKIGGKMVIPLGNTSAQKMIMVEKIDENNYKQSEHGDFVFVPMISGKAN
ncbi:MAG: protein-L-isoaspartate(D-aspartate) O-methyltransferase [bacterium]